MTTSDTPVTGEPASLAGMAREPGRTRGVRLPAIVRALRPYQWIKNGFVLTPILFAGPGANADVIGTAFAFAAFCLLSSGIYLLNDVVDREADRVHPVKRLRPIASGEVGWRTAATLGVVLLAVALSGSLLLSPRVAAFTLTYVLLNVAYSLKLKQVVILDVFTVASFFVLRLLAGAAAANVAPSIWLLLCGGLLALYLGFAKRRHELGLLQETSSNHRLVLSQYSVVLLDQLSVMLLAITVVAYIMYTLESATARAVGSDLLAYSTAFVLYGVTRYLFLVHREGGGDPAESLLTDRSLLAAVLFWLTYCGIVIYAL
jgi:4-hydroxybenzoate polyprenyltransferase